MATPASTGNTNSLEESSKHFKKLAASGAVGIQRPVRIEATPCAPDGGDEGAAARRAQLPRNQKIVHLQRHGQGFHNLLSDKYRELGITWDPTSQNLASNPYALPEMVDPPLTDKGRQQCKAQRGAAAKISAQVVLVSPLSRAVQTALMTFEGLVGKVPFVAVESARESIGRHTCDQRRSRTDAELEFGQHVDFGLIKDDHDALWTQEHRETPIEEANRVYEFLLYVRQRPESELVVVTHSGYLFNMLNAVVDCSKHPEQSTWFETAEIRSMCLTFHGEQST